MSSEAQLTNVSNQLGFFQAFKVILTTRVLLIRTLAVIFNWLTNNLVYYGLTLGTGDLKWGSPYLNFALSTTVELIAIICSHYCFNKFGRKIPYLVCMLLAGLSLVVVIFVPNNHPELITVIALIGKFSISLTYNGIYIITTETYPTFIRNTAVSVSQFITRFGAVAAPYINLLVNIRIFKLEAILKKLIFHLFRVKYTGIHQHF
jgi:MFS transporter, OCT family, solute carrier family 22 (organic cation transporter), member 4/5